MGDLLGSPRVAPLLFRSRQLILSWRRSSTFCDSANGVVIINATTTNISTCAIIPARMHLILSELRSEAFFGESSTRMGDLLGSPRVALLLFRPRQLILS